MPPSCRPNAVVMCFCLCLAVCRGTKERWNGEPHKRRLSIRTLSFAMRSLKFSNARNKFAALSKRKSKYMKLLSFTSKSEWSRKRRRPARAQRSEETEKEKGNKVRTLADKVYRCRFGFSNFQHFLFLFGRVFVRRLLTFYCRCGQNQFSSEVSHFALSPARLLACSLAQ